MSRTEAVRQALEALYDGASVDDAEALLDQLTDRGFEVVAMSAVRAASKRRTG